ncbi:hypothetical protein HaLaN_30943, partial [Haematococcus lacustris]
MDVRRSGCLLTRGQAQAYAATPELSTELALPVKEFLSSSLAASPYTSDIPDTPAGLLSIEPGTDVVDATFTLPGLDPIELAVSQVSGVSAATGSSGISPRNSPIVMAASLVAHGILPSPVQLEQRVVQAGGQSLAPRNRMARPFSSRGPA